jgi:hypothetical protein
LEVLEAAIRSNGEEEEEGEFEEYEYEEHQHHQRGHPGGGGQCDSPQGMEFAMASYTPGS